MVVKLTFYTYLWNTLKEALLTTHILSIYIASVRVNVIVFINLSNSSTFKNDEVRGLQAKKGVNDTVQYRYRLSNEEKVSVVRM